VTHLIGLSGSLRQGSFNTALLRAAVALMPENAELAIGSIREIPLYDGDREAADGIPEPVAALKDAIAAADGLLLVTPEYNNSIPGVFKNAIDWLTRPPADIKRVFGGKPVALMGASPGGFGTILSQSAWLPVFRTVGFLVRGAPDGVARPERVQPGRNAVRPKDRGAASTFPSGFRRCRWITGPQSLAGLASSRTLAPPVPSCTGLTRVPPPNQLLSCPDLIRAPTPILGEDISNTRSSTHFSAPTVRIWTMPQPAISSMRSGTLIRSKTAARRA
jgi:chromate reductase